jgi:CDP-glycerol glycerophosphotransferase (TagB/SpsB family)
MIGWKKIWIEIKYWSQVFLLPIYAASHIVPKSKKIWVFGSTFGRRFADNPKYFYLFVAKYYSDIITAVWITKNREIAKELKKKGLKAYYLYSVMGICYSVIAKVYVFDNYTKDICFSLSGGSVKINLWHGIPLKKIQNDNIFDKVRKPQTLLLKIRWALRRLTDEKPNHYILTTSNNLIQIFSSAFRTQKILNCGYPRNDILLSELMPSILLPMEEDCYSEITNYPGKIILYMPTFRESETELLRIIDWSDLQSTMENNHMLFCIKLHPKSKLKDILENEIRAGFNNIRLLNPDYDPYPLLKHTECLVTDYSSIYFDYLFTEHKIIFFDYDLKEYTTHSREMYFDYKDITPGQKVSTQKELIDALVAVDSYREERKRLREKMFDLDNGCASERLYKKISDIIA